MFKWEGIMCIKYLVYLTLIFLLMSMRIPEISKRFHDHMHTALFDIVK